MQFGPWDTLFNVGLFILWFRIWCVEERTQFFNPYLAPLDRASRSVIDFLRPVFFGAPPRLIALFSLVLLLALRAAALLPRAPGELRLGFEVAAPDTGSIVSSLVFSLLSFSLFLFKLWGFSLLYDRARNVSALDRTIGTLHSLARPFSDLRIVWRPLALLGFGVGIGLLVNVAGVTDRAWQGLPASVMLARLVISSLAAWVSILMLLRSFVVALIIGSLVSMFAGAPAIMQVCREWVDTLMGPLRRYPIRIGMFDLTPLVFIFVVGFIYAVLMMMLLGSYSTLE